jgi:hypothetical protein
VKKTTFTRSTIIALNTDRLEDLKKQLLAAKGSYVKVGILGDSDDARPKVPGKLSGPTLGAVHELGSASAKPSPIPRRSFLKDPLISQLPERIQAMGPEAWRKAILEKGVLFALKVLGNEAENVVQRGFSTGGYGKWAPLAPYTIKKKGSTSILIERGFMRKAVHSAVVKK